MRVLTWNVWWRFGPWEERRRAIRAVLRDLQPDAVGLQEVWADADENLAEWLADDLGLHWTWEPSRAPETWQRRLGDPTVDFGNAVLSRWPIVEREVMQLPSAPGPGPNPGPGQDDGRLALYACLDNPAGRVPFFTTHLTSAVDASAVRCEQVGALAEFVADKLAEGASGGALSALSMLSAFPPVITGDFNAWPDSDEVRRFGGYKTAPAVPGQVFLDAWEYADPAQPSATWDPANPYVAATFGPGVRIDYIHVGPPRARAASATSRRSGASETGRRAVCGRPTTPRSSRS